MLLLTVLLAVVTAHELPTILTWEEWKLEYGDQRMLMQGADEVTRKAQFEANVEKIKAQNELFEAGESTFYYGFNHFTDLSIEEFRVAAGFRKRPERTTPKNVVLLDESNTASAVDWRNHNAVTPVKNQGQCGSCWSFSATGAMEGDLAVEAGQLISLSEKELMDCSTENHNCEGGLMDYAFDWVINNGGIDSEADYPYSPVDGTCNVIKQRKKVAKFTRYQDVAGSNISQMQLAVAKQPIAVAIEADKEVFQLYGGGVLDNVQCGYGLDHGVLVVGMTEVNDGSFPNAFIVKNSWGSGWGLSGYIYISMETDTAGSRGICGILEEPSYITGGQVVSQEIQDRLVQAASA